MVPSPRPTATGPLARLQDRSGQSLAEFVLVGPILLLLAFAIIEFGFAFRTHQIVTNVAREGARVAVLTEATDGDVRDAVASRLRSAGLDPALADIEIRCDAEVGMCTGLDRTGRGSEVEVAYPYRFIVLGGLVKIAGGGDDNLGQVSLRGRSLMRNE
jgi:Flp pilus assembly protein TadG